METKKVSMKISGKDGEVNTTYIQKHFPTSPMLLITTENNYSIFVQDNHPLFVKENEDIIEIESKLLNKEIHSIFVDNSIIYNESAISPIYRPGEVFQVLMNILENNKIIELPKISILKGTTYDNIRFESDFIKYSKKWINLFLQYYIPFQEYFSTVSFTLATQIKLMANRVGFDSEVIPVVKDGLECFSIRVLNNVSNQQEFLNGYYKIKSIYEISNWKYYIYDVKTDTKEFMNNCVQNHNSFHCCKSNSIIHLRKEGETFNRTFEEIWNDTDAPVILNGAQEEKITTNLEVLDKDNIYTKIQKIIRHKKQPGTKMIFMRNENNDFIICQDNHPNMIRVDTEEEFKPICINEMNEKNKYYSNISNFEWGAANKKPPIDPYLFGMFLAEGSYLYYHYAHSKPLEGFIITQGKGKIQDRIIEKVQLMEQNNEIRRFSVNGQNYRTAEQIVIYSDILSEIMLNTTGRYSRERSMGPDYIHYSDEDLAKILCGVIDGEGSFIKSRKFISLEVTSVILIQQLHHILNKFGIHHRIRLASVKNLTRNQSYVLWIYPAEKDKKYLQYCSKLNENCFLNIKERIGRTKDKSLINYKKEILFDENDYVYDLTTESSTLIVNGMWTHNTGSTLSLSKIDILENLKENVSITDYSIIDKAFKQTDLELFTNVAPLILEINTKIYEDKYKIEVMNSGKELLLPLGYFTMSFGGMKIVTTIEQPVTVFVPETKEESDGYLKFFYNENDKILKMEPQRSDPTDVARKLDEYIGGKSPWTTPETLYTKFFKNLSDLRFWDSVHLEIVICNILRNRLNPQIPARLKEPYDPITFSVKTLPSIISYSLGLSYENFGKAVQFGLISDRGIESPLEKIMFGIPLVEEDAKKLEKRK